MIKADKLMAENREIIVAMTGASGAAYGLRLMQRLAQSGFHQHILFSDAARVVLKQECDLILPDDVSQVPFTLAKHLDVSPEMFVNYGLKDWFSPAASGSSDIHQMVVAPCSMGTLARIATGISDNLIERAADVVLKERRHLILMPRETPLSAIHLEHMLKLSRLGVDLLPAMPGFYHRPSSLNEIVDFMVNRVLDHLHVPHTGPRWSAGDN